MFLNERFQQLRADSNQDMGVVILGSGIKENWDIIDLPASHRAGPLVVCVSTSAVFSDQKLLAWQDSNIEMT